MKEKTILVNGEKVNGAFSFTVTKNENVKPAVITVEGIMSCDKYIEEIDTIENEWFKLRDVNVFQESFGSDDNMFGYTFTAAGYEIMEA